MLLLEDLTELVGRGAKKCKVIVSYDGIDHHVSNAIFIAGSKGQPASLVLTVDRLDEIDAYETDIDDFV